MLYYYYCVLMYSYVQSPSWSPSPLPPLLLPFSLLSFFTSSPPSPCSSSLLLPPLFLSVYSSLLLPPRYNATIDKLILDATNGNITGADSRVQYLQETGMQTCIEMYNCTGRKNVTRQDDRHVQFF